MKIVFNPKIYIFICIIFLSYSMNTPMWGKPDICPTALNNLTIQKAASILGIDLIQLPTIKYESDVENYRKNAQRKLEQGRNIHDWSFELSGPRPHPRDPELDYVTEEFRVRNVYFKQLQEAEALLKVYAQLNALHFRRINNSHAFKRLSPQTKMYFENVVKGVKTLKDIEEAKNILLDEPNYSRYEQFIDSSVD